MSTFACPHCQKNVSVSNDQLGSTIACPKCGGAFGTPQVEADSFDFREDEETYRARRMVRETRKANGWRIALWAIFGGLILIGKFLDKLAGPDRTPLDKIEHVAYLFSWFLVCFAIDRILSTANE
jgi:hypothetical protein